MPNAMCDRWWTLWEHLQIWTLQLKDWKKFSVWKALKHLYHRKPQILSTRLLFVCIYSIVLSNHSWLLLFWNQWYTCFSWQRLFGRLEANHHSCKLDEIIESTPLSPKSRTVEGIGHWIGSDLRKNWVDTFGEITSACIWASVGADMLATSSNHTSNLTPLSTKANFDQGQKVKANSSKVAVQREASLLCKIQFSRYKFHVSLSVLR